MYVSQRQLLDRTIPTELGNMIELKHFHLYKNNLAGRIPLELGNCTSVGTISRVKSYDLNKPQILSTM